MFYISTNWARSVVGWYSTRERILEIFVCLVCFISDSYLGNNFIQNAYTICTSYYPSCNRKYFGSFFRSPFITNLLVKCAIFFNILDYDWQILYQIRQFFEIVRNFDRFCALAYSNNCFTVFSVLSQLFSES
jgi:hypothetical protein